jgi:hypothetical protein
MSFRRFGGLQYSAKNNIITNHFSNSGNLGITDTLGQPNSKIVCQSHIDMNGNSILNTGDIIFVDGSSLNDTIEVLLREIQDLKARISELESKG